MDCGRSDRGLQLHHIVGRDSNSAFNAIVLCNVCHEKCNHSQEEERKYFKTTFNFLLITNYEPTENDLKFLRDYFNRLVYNNIKI